MVAAQALDGLFAGEPEILADDLTRTVRAQLSQPPQAASYSRYWAGGPCVIPHTSVFRPP